MDWCGIRKNGGKTLKTSDLKQCRNYKESRLGCDYEPRNKPVGAKSEARPAFPA